MEENDISNVIDKFSSILKEKDININDFVNSNNNSTENNDTNSENENNFNFDINTILKLKKIIDKLNNSTNNRSSLLVALKPFLSNKKQSKVDEYIKIVNILSVLESLNGEL